MKKLKMFVAIISAMIALKGIAQSNDSCVTSMQICVETQMSLPAGVGTGSAGNGIACLNSAPNPAWFCFQVEQPGRINISLSSEPQNDLDFACWGPFTANSFEAFQSSGSCSQLKIDVTTLSHGPANGINPAELGGYPVDNLVDCSFTSEPVEFVHVPAALAGEWYLILVTNYSNQPSVVSVVSDTSSVGTSNCDLTSSYLLLSEDTISDLVDLNICGDPAPKSYFLSGNYLLDAPDAILVIAPPHYEVALSQFVEFSDSIYVYYNYAILPQTQIYVRLKSDLEFGDYNSEPIIHSGGGADPVVLICNGRSENPYRVNENDPFVASVYPNPTAEVLKCTFKSITNRKLSIVDVLGKTVKSWNSKVQEEMIDVKFLPNGVYFLKVEEDGNQYSTKFVIKKE